jgi:hypothetical protein
MNIRQRGIIVLWILQASLSNWNCKACKVPLCPTHPNHTAGKDFPSLGAFPIMHLVVLRRENYEPNRFVAASLFQALDDRKEMARKRMELKTALQYMIPWLGQELDDIQETFGGDYWPYGWRRSANLGGTGAVPV